MNEAIGKIRAALKGHDLLGAEAIDLKPGAVVLVVLRHPAYADRAVVESLGRLATVIADLLPRCVSVVLPEGFGLEVVEVADGATLPDDGPLPSPREEAEAEAIAQRAHAAAQAFVAHVFTGPKSTEGMTPEEVEAAKAREREAFPLRVVTFEPLPDEPFPWDAPAEGYGVAALGDPPSAKLAGYPVDRITSERREHVRAFLARDLGGLTRLPDDAAIDFEAGTVKR